MDFVHRRCWRLWRGVLFAGGAGGDALCATLYAGGCEGGLCSLEVLEMPEALEILEQEVMRYVLLCMLELVESEFCSLEVLEVLRYVP